MTAQKKRPPASLGRGTLCCLGSFVAVGLFVGGGQVVGLGVELADDAGGDAGDDGVGGYVFRDDRPGPHDGSVPDGDAGDDGDAGADPDVFARDDGGGVGGGAMFWVKVVVHGGQDHVVAQKRPVPQGDAALVLEVAAGVDEDALDKQLTIAGCDDRRELPFQKAILNKELPYTIGGGIGQSRICMFFLRKAHIGEVHASLWPEEVMKEAEAKGVQIL